MSERRVNDRPRLKQRLKRVDRFLSFSFGCHDLRIGYLITIQTNHRFRKHPSVASLLRSADVSQSHGERSEPCYCADVLSHSPAHDRHPKTVLAFHPHRLITPRAVVTRSARSSCEHERSECERSLFMFAFMFALNVTHHRINN